MPRKGLRPRDRRPQPAPDFKHNSVLVARFINKLNFEGKKATAERILNDALNIIADKTKEDGVSVFNKCIEMKVAAVIGDAFYPNGKTDRSMRVNYSNMPDERIIEGIKRMAKAIKECM